MTRGDHHEDHGGTRPSGDPDGEASPQAAEHGDGGHGHGEHGHHETYTGVEQEFGLFALFTTLCSRRQDQVQTAEEIAEQEERKKQGHEAHEGDPSQMWFGLFTDLIFVAVIIKFANQIKFFIKGFFINNHGDYIDDYHVGECKANKKLGAKLPFYDSKGNGCQPEGGIGTFGTIMWQTLLWFFAFWVMWLELNCALTRFINLEGILDDFLYMIFLAGVITMAVQMNHTQYFVENRLGFSTGLIMCTFSMTALHSLFFIYAPKSVSYSWRRICGYSFATTVFTIGLFCGEDGTCICMAIGLMAMCWISLTGFMQQPQVEITIEHFVV